MANTSLPENVDELLARHRTIWQQLPNTGNAFFVRFGKLRPIQLAAIPEILKGNNALITAPTAGGKTEAVAPPLCEQWNAKGTPSAQSGSSADRRHHDVIAFAFPEQ
ncbi:MAG: DEAD/DEAH box helicase [Limisphaerales bacterium]